MPYHDIVCCLHNVIFCTVKVLLISMTSIIGTEYWSTGVLEYRLPNPPALEYSSTPDSSTPVPGTRVLSTPDSSTPVPGTRVLSTFSTRVLEY